VRAAARPDDDAVVAASARTPFGRFGERFAALRLSTLGAVPVTAVLERLGVEAAQVDELVFGVNFPGAERSVARQVALDAGVPDDRAAYTIDRACCSALTSVGLVARSVRLGVTTIGVAGGVENLSGVPHVLPGARFGTRLGPPPIVDPLVVTCPYTGVPRAVQAGVEALEFGVERAEQDDWAVRSHALYWEADARGAVQAGSAVVDVDDRAGRRCLLEVDECARRDVDVAALAALPTVYGSPTVTAGNAPNLATGATAVVVMRRALARDLGRLALARVVASVQTAGEPPRIASVPARAAALALELSGLSLEDVHVIEINEAFAAVPLVTTSVLAGGDRQRAATLRERTNRWGGAIALGHPTGATGARLLMSAIAQLEERGGGLGLVTICGGIGEAEAMIVEVAEA